MTSSAVIVADTLEPHAWDTVLAQLGGHPLQSAAWGSARQCSGRTGESRWLAKQEGKVVWMARVEERRIPGVGRVAWVPRGPTVHPDADVEMLTALFQLKLRDAGFVLAVMSPWQVACGGADFAAAKNAAPVRPATIWIDLGVGRDRLWQGLDKQWRYGVGKAKRSRVTVRQTNDPEQIDWFFGLCRSIGRAKGFSLPASAALMRRLIRHGQTGSVQARLFVAELDGRPGAGAFIMSCGSSIHYMWGGTDREFAKLRLGEAVQWGVMEWALAEGCRLYDLEGIDPANNPGTYAFKKKMGGTEILLVPRMVWPLTLRGRLLARFV